MRLVYGPHLADWAASKMEHCPPDPFGPCQCVGVEDRELVAVCVYHNYVKEHGRCEISFAASSPRWARKGIIRALLSIPFEQYGCQAVYTFTAHTNTRALRFNEGIGLINPVQIEDYFGPGRHAVVRRMKRDEFFARYGVTGEAA